jgi:hypothetical protein
MHETGQIPNPAAIADRLAIYDVLVRHSRGVDRGDAAVLTSAYWPDAEVAYGVQDCRFDARRSNSSRIMSAHSSSSS